MANRHGLITGATGTGKTVTLQLLAENFSRLGVPVFSADIKGDLSGLARPGTTDPRIDARIARIGITDHCFEGCPVLFEDEPVGTVTSGGFGPSAGGPVCMGHVLAGSAEPGTGLSAMVRNKPLPVTVCELPFVPHRYFRGK